MKRFLISVLTLSALAATASPASAWRWSATLAPGQSSAIVGFFPSIEPQCAPKGTLAYYASYATSYGWRWHTDGGAPRADYYRASRGFKNVGSVIVTCYAS